MPADDAPGKGIAPTGQVRPLPRGQGQVGDVAHSDVIRGGGRGPGGELIGSCNGLRVGLGSARGPGTEAGAKRT